VLDDHTVELGAQDKELVLQVGWQGLKKLFFLLFLESSILNPWVILVGKILLLHHCALGVPMNWHTCLVSSDDQGVLHAYCVWCGQGSTIQWLLHVQERLHRLVWFQIVLIIYGCLEVSFLWSITIHDYLGTSGATCFESLYKICLLLWLVFEPIYLRAHNEQDTT
jgi:hypothetical protein